MPTYAILGATGNTGQAILKILLQDKTTTIKAYCRSKPKLLHLTPSAASSPNLQIHEGSLSNTQLLTSCLRNTDAAFLCVAVPNNKPNCTIAQDTAAAVITALRTLRDEDAMAKLPRLVVLSSAATEACLCGEIPAWGLAILKRSESYLYADLEVAEEVLRAQDWSETVFVKPGALTVDEAKGYEFSVDSMGLSPLPYADLARGMVEVAEGKRVFEKGFVAVVSTGKARFPWVNIWYTSSGLLFHYFPWTYSWIG